MIEGFLLQQYIGLLAQSCLKPAKLLLRQALEFGAQLGKQDSPGKSAND